MKIGVIQLTSKLDYQENLFQIEKELKHLQQEKVESVFLPECFYSLSNGLKPTPHLVEKNNHHFENIRNLASKYQMNLLGGSVAYREEGKIFNRALNFSHTGKLIDFYNKIHLFKIKGKKQSIDESDIYEAGSSSVVSCIDSWKMGNNICFDLRFSEQANEYRKAGVHLLTYAAAFTRPTGKAHWHTLLRARAIENQCYVVAAAQCGENNERIKTYGHSLIIDPWGEVLIDLGNDVGSGSCEISLEKIQEVRDQIPM